MRVLHILNGLNTGGAETFIYQMLKVIPNEKIQFDFLLRNNGENDNKLLLDLCEKKNCKIYQTAPYPTHAIKNYIQVKQILWKKDYDLIHVHANALIYIIPIFVAKKNNIKVILHSHNTKSNKNGFLPYLIHNVNYFLIRRIPKVNVACGEEAGHWMFKKDKFNIIDNAIDINTYLYSQEKNMSIRNQYELKNETVLGHSGRFVDAKNHVFLIKVFKEYLLINPNSRLFLLGEGDLEGKIKKIVCDEGIENKVIFTGNVTNVNEYLSMFDLFVFPSLFEGLPFSLIEAQASGVPILTSTGVSRESDIGGDIIFYDLNKTAHEWATKIDGILHKKHDRTLTGLKVKTSKYDISKSAEKLLKIYNDK